MTDQTLQSVERFTRILTLLSEADGLRIAELARRAALGRSLVQRYVDSFLGLGLVARDRDGFRYRVTAKVLEFSHNAVLDDWRDLIVRPRLLAVGARTGWPLSFTSIRGARLVVIENSDDESPLISTPVRRGLNMPLLGSASGEVLLAHKPAQIRDRLLRIVLATDSPSRPRRSVEEVVRGLEQLRAEGYAIRSGPSTAWSSLAVPVLQGADADFAVSLRFHALAITPKDARRGFLADLLSLARQLSAELKDIDTRW